MLNELPIKFTNPTPNDDTSVHFFPTCGRLSPGGDHWQIAICGRAITPRPDNLRKAVLMRVLCRALNVSADELESSIYRDRLADFLMLGQRDRNISIRISDRLYPLKKPSKKSGYFESSIRVPMPELELPSHPSSATPFPTIQFQHGAPQETPHTGLAQLVPPVGPSVISDIDDTLKVTEATDRKAMLVNTFLRPFQAIHGMAQLYQTWATRAVAFHYVSASPWPLFRPLHEFLEQQGFPGGSFHLRRIKIQGTGPLRLLIGGKRDKRKSVRNILRWYPHRRFLLIGDSGERDPEIYGWAARRFPDQVQQICIRRVSTIKRKRLKAAFRGVPSSKWRIYDATEELSDIIAIAQAGWEFRDR